MGVFSLCHEMSRGEAFILPIDDGEMLARTGPTWPSATKEGQRKEEQMNWGGRKTNQIQDVRMDNYSMWKMWVGLEP